MEEYILLESVIFESSSSSSSTDSDDNDEALQDILLNNNRAERRAVPKIRNYLEHVVARYTDNEFKIDLFYSNIPLAALHVHFTDLYTIILPMGETKRSIGGTGSLGKILTEKLLRSCPEISMIYLLIRPKQDKSPEIRLDKMFEKPLYDRLKKEVPNFRQKIIPIIGDFDIEDFGLSENDKNILINKVSIVFHIAANVRFNEKIKVSITVNVNGTATILKLAKNMLKLKSFVYVSTIYANFYVKHIEERFYSQPINHNDLITMTRNLPENVIKEKISKILSRWPNMYTFTKAIAEGVLENESGDLPIGIFRPSLVVSTAREPFAGWVDSIHGPLGIMVPSLCGILRFYRCNGDYKSNIVPLDFTINALIASAWDVFNNHRRGKGTLIYNFVPPIDGPTWNDYKHTLFNINKIYPLHNAIYFPFLVLYQRKIYKIFFWIGHFLPALLVDIVYICINRKPKMWKLYKRADTYSKLVESFSTNEWSYSTDNVQAMWKNLNEQDQRLFKFNMIEFDWTKYFIDQYKGIRLYLLNEDDSTLEISRIKYKRFYWLHQIFKTVLIFAVPWIIWIIFTIVYT